MVVAGTEEKCGLNYVDRAGMTDVSKCNDHAGAHPYKMEHTPVLT